MDQAANSTPIRSEDIQAIVAWIEEHEASAPACVRSYLVLQKRHLAAGISLDQRLRTMYRELQRAFGVLPKSERRKSGHALDVPAAPPKKKVTNERERLEHQLARSNDLRQWHHKLEIRHDGKAKKLKNRLANLSDKGIEQVSEQEITEDTPVEDIELSPEQEADCEEASRVFRQNLCLGDGPAPALATSGENLLSGSLAEHVEDEVYVEAELREGIDESQVLKTWTSRHERYDFSVQVRRLAVHVEKKVVATEQGTKMLSARTTDLGPPRYSVTWGALATLAILVGQFAMPLHRIATLLSSPAKRFTAGGLSRMLRYIAVRLVAIYLELADQLSDSDVLSGDDAPCRVVEVASHFKKHKDEPPPWSAYGNRAQAQVSHKTWYEQKSPPDASEKRVYAADDNIPLGVRLAAELGFEYPRRNGNGVKRSINTTVVTGRGQADDPKSSIVFYRSHLGHFGNLTETLLEKRRPAARELIVQGDLSPSNLVTSPELLSRFVITQAGCSSHARRPFAIHEDDDRVYCEYILHLFKGLAIHEDCLDRQGRNRENVLAVRGTESRRLWNSIRKLAEEMTEKWSKATKLGAAARYIITHFDKLTAYLSNPRIEATNNHRERMLRTEKLIEKSSMFRRSLEGRFALDIIRTIIQTCIAAGVSPYNYLIAIMKTDSNEIAASPEKYTPYAWATNATTSADS